MKPTTKTVKKLNLNRETIRTLDSLRILAVTELAAVNGGRPTQFCSPSERVTCEHVQG